MPAFFLAFVFVTELATVAPVIKEPYTSLDDCLAAALKANARDETLREPDNFKRGAHYVCLQLRVST